MTVEREPSSGQQIDDDAVKRYFDGSGGTSAAMPSTYSPGVSDSFQGIPG